MDNSQQFATLDQSVDAAADYELARRNAPRIRFDKYEPFLPSVVGYTVFRADAPSVSFPRQITLPPGAACAIEYAIWWDWDMGHLYELEHIWVYLDANETLVAAEASWHGGFHAMLTEAGQMPIEDGRLTIYSESGKHAFAPSPAMLLARAEMTIRECGGFAGMMGVHVTPLFEGFIHERMPPNNQLVRTYLQRLAFAPSFEYSQLFDLATVPYVPWARLFQWIPTRIKWWTEELERTIPLAERASWRIAHRGASAHAQENSIASIRKAVELGADMIEVDVRITADSVPVISHDADLKRVYGVDGLIEHMTLDQLLALTPPGQEPIVTFEELVKLCYTLAVGIYLDIKALNDPAAAFMYETLKRYDMLNFTLWASHMPDRVAEIKARAPKVLTSILFSSLHVDPVLVAKAVKCDYVHPCWERFEEPHTFLTETWLEGVRNAGLGIICWHEERPAVIHELRLRGVDGICSDEPELLSNVFA